MIAFRNVLMTRHLVKYVQDLVVEIFPVSRSDSRKLNHGITELLQRLDKTREYELTGTVQDTFHDLYKLDHLSTLTIRFDCKSFGRRMDALQKDVSFRRRILTSVLTPLLCLPSIKPPIHCLSVENLLSCNEPKVTNTAWFIDLLRNLRTLVLGIWQIDPWESPYWDVPQTICFFQSLPDTWLRPACQNLRSLYLSGGREWGWYPKADFRHIHFPLLQGLMLHSFVFSHDWQLEWLLSLAGSLRYLRLSSCSILSFADTTPQFLDGDGYLVCEPGPQNRFFEGEWSHYFAAFARELPLLQLFSLQWASLRNWRVGTEDVPVRRDLELEAFHYDSPYTYFKGGGYIPSKIDRNEDPASVEAPQQATRRRQLHSTQDEQALLKLLDTIEERKTASL